MTHTEGRFSSATSGETYWQAWVPDAPKAVVVLSHGISEHSGRYVHVAERLNAGGYAVYALDHHGHGKSSGTPGNIESFPGVVEDVHTLRGMAEKAHPGLPVVVVGHSMGGLVTLGYLVTKSDRGLAAVVVSGPAVDLSVASKVERMIAPLVSRIAPNLALTDLGIDNISRDPKVVQAYRDDPLVYTGKVRARTGAECLAILPRVLEGLGRLTLPALVMHGGADRLVSPVAGKLVYDGLGSEDKAHKVYDGLFHEIFNEPEQDAVLDDVLSWLDARISPA